MHFLVETLSCLSIWREENCQPKKSLKENPFQFTKNEVKLTCSNLEVQTAKHIIRIFYYLAEPPFTNCYGTNQPSTYWSWAGDPCWALSKLAMETGRHKKERNLEVVDDVSDILRIIPQVSWCFFQLRNAFKTAHNNSVHFHQQS